MTTVEAEITIAVGVDGLAAARGRVAGREIRRQPRPLPRRDAEATDVVLPGGQEPRPVPTQWPQTCTSRAEVEAGLPELTAGVPGTATARAMGVRRMLEWLETMPGATWQQRWHASGADQAGQDWVDLVPLGTGNRGGGTSRVTVIRSGLALLLIGQVIRPSLAWLLAQKHSQTLARAFAAIDPTGLAALRRAYESGQRSGGRPQRAVNILARIMIHKGGPLSAVTVGDCVQYWQVRRERGRSNAEGTLFYTLLFDMGIFGPDAPPTLTAATRRGPRSCAELIDRYEIACTPVRDLLVEYLSVRQPTVDHTSLAGIAAHLGLLFWKDLERHHPGIDSLDLPVEVATAWKQRLRTIAHGHAKGQYHLACHREGPDLPFPRCGCGYRVDVALVGEVDCGGSVVAGSLVAWAFHREAVVAGSFDHARIAAVTHRVEVAFRGDLRAEFGGELVLVIRGKNRPDLRRCRGSAGRSG